MLIDTSVLVALLVLKQFQFDAPGFHEERQQSLR
jgi:hypothetical protein